MAKQKIKSKNIFNGEYLMIWGDGEIVFVNTPCVTINMTKEEWNYFKRDIDKLAEL